MCATDAARHCRQTNVNFQHPPDAIVNGNYLFTADKLSVYERERRTNQPLAASSLLHVQFIHIFIYYENNFP